MQDSWPAPEQEPEKLRFRREELPSDCWDTHQHGHGEIEICLGQSPGENPGKQMSRVKACNDLVVTDALCIHSSLFLLNISSFTVKAWPFGHHETNHWTD